MKMKKRHKGVRWHAQRDAARKRRRLHRLRKRK